MIATRPGLQRMAFSRPIHFSHYRVNYLHDVGFIKARTSICPYVPAECHTNCTPDNAWVVLKSPATPAEEISILRQKVKYLAVLPNMEGAVVLLDDGLGILQPQTAYYIADNIIFVCDGSVRATKTVRMVLYRNPVMIFTSGGDGVIFSTVDLTAFLYSVGENVIVNKMLQTDGCYGVIDRYTLAMSFIYLKRANVTDTLFTNILAVLAALLLAHKIEEDDAPGRALLRLIYYCLPRGMTEDEKNRFICSITSFESTLFRKTAYRVFVTSEECEEIIAVAPFHPFWKRWRLSFHGGAVRDCHQNWKIQFIHVSFCATAARSSAGFGKCIMCKGNHHYSQDVQDRFALQPSFCTQKLHLTHILSSITEKYQMNLRRASCCSESDPYYTTWPSVLSTLNYDRNWPLEYIHLLEIENRIETILCDEHFLEKYAPVLKQKQFFFTVSMPPVY